MGERRWRGEGATHERARDEAINDRALEIMERRRCNWVEAWTRALAEQRLVERQGDLEERAPSRHRIGRAGRVTLSEQIGRAMPPHRGTVAPGRMTRSVALPAAVMRSAERAEIDPEAAELVARARRGGAPLDDVLRPQLEAALGTRLDGVRVHTGADADAAARALGARAFAIGDDVFFRDGAYDPHQRDGQRLIAHEVAHTVQARGASVPTGETTTVSQPGDAPEREADAFADAFMRSARTRPEEPAAHAGEPRAGSSEPAGSRRQIEGEEDRAASLFAVDRAAPIAVHASQAQVHRFDHGAHEPAEKTTGSRTGPTVNPGNGTTAELQAERRRLVDEQSDYHYSTIEPEREQVYNQYTSTIARLDVLLAERGNSTLPDSTVALTFNGLALTMAGSSSGSWPAVSGRPDDTGTFDYSAARQHQRDIGPIPAGVYWIDPSQMVDLQSRWFYSLRYEQPWGTHRITIHPFDSTPTFGRGGFFIHGGGTPGSAGCIDLTSHMADFARRLGATPPGTKVKITVAY